MLENGMWGGTFIVNYKYILMEVQNQRKWKKEDIFNSVLLGNIHEVILIVT